MEDENIICYGFYDKDNKKFLLNSNSKKSFEELYKKCEPTQKIQETNGNILINEKGIKNIKYFYNNPHKIKFIYQNGKVEKEIFISNMYQFLQINTEISEGKDLKTFISDDGINYIQNDSFEEMFASNFIKYCIFSIDDKDYKILFQYKKENAPLSLSNLSLNYNYYLENTTFVEDKNNFFLNTDKRKKFFEFLNNKLKNNNYLALCGLEGIGKTASILAYLKYYKQTYFYFNVKTIDKLLAEKEIHIIKKIILNEMYHFIGLEDVEKYDEFLNELLEKNNSAMGIFKNIFEKIKNSVQIIVLDQYKTIFDRNYDLLENIIKLNKRPQIIIMSSMNEDDIKKSIILSLKWALKLIKEKPKLDYYYIIDLVKVTENEINNLSKEEKKILNEFGNLYIYYYKIKSEIKNNPNFNLDLDFKNKIKEEMDRKIQVFYQNIQTKELLNTFITLILNDEKEKELKDCIDLIDYIPLRFFKFNYKNENIVHFSELSSTDKISFNSAFIYIREYFLNYYYNIIVNTGMKEKDQNNDKKQKHNEFEDFFGYFLWAFRGVIELNKTNIVDYIKINSMIDMKDEYIEPLNSKVSRLKDNESILIFHSAQNEKVFDFGIIEKKNGMYNLYLIQVSTNKKSDERITITALNDNANYLDGFFKVKLNIDINNNYFCYIFDYNAPDTYLIQYCKINNIDYLLFDAKNLRLNGDLVLKPLKYHLPVFKYVEGLSNFDRMINIEKIKFSECVKDDLINRVKETKDFLAKKRSLMKKKDNELIELKELEELTKYEPLVQKNNNNVVYTNYERKEFIINNYLLSNQFKGQKIFGISYKKNKNELNFEKNRKENLFELCGKSIEEDDIFQIDKLNISSLLLLKPEFGIYIVLKIGDKIYLFDFINKKYYDLDNKNEESFTGKKMFGIGDFYSIIFLNKNIKI